MFATKGRLKVTLLVVGVLAVGFGLYAAFDIHDAHAHTAAIHSWDISYAWHWVSSVRYQSHNVPSLRGLSIRYEDGGYLRCLQRVNS